MHVVRDDLLRGGTKERGLRPVVEDLVRGGATRFVYASPFCGYAQIALATTVVPLGAAAIVFSDVAPGGATLHPYSLEARAHGAEVHPCATLADAEARADAYTRAHPGAVKLPLGFACSAFHAAYVAAIRVEWQRLLATVGRRPRHVFVPVGSGTLLRAFAEALDGSVDIHAIDVRVLALEDPRLAVLDTLPRVTVHRAVQPFAQPSDQPPPFPSNPYYDAKLLPFVDALAEDGSVWWNVAR